MTIERTVYVKLPEEVECIKLQEGLLILNELYFKKGEAGGNNVVSSNL